jgi:ABC-type multidrug transport system fused ATPase/permease subunit
MKILNQIIFILSPYERKRAFILLIMILIMAILDVIGVASILPFITVLANPGIIEDNIVLKYIYNYSALFGVENVHDFTIVLGVIVFIVLITSLAFKSLAIYAQLLFVSLREYSIGKRLMQCYLSQPYSWFLSRHSADFSKTVLSEVNLIISQALTPLIALLANGALVAAIFLLLIIIEPIIALTITSIFALSYFIIYYLVHGYLKIIGQDRLRANNLRFTYVSEAFGAIKEVKFAGLENIYIDRFAETSKIFAKHQASALILSQLPRFAIEGVAFGGIIIVIIYYLVQTNNFTNALPLVSLYAFAGYRVLPALQKIYNSITLLRFMGPALDNLLEELKINQPKITLKKGDSLPFKKSIRLKNIYYNYPNTKKLALKNINLEIFAHTTVGLAGATGSGKTTIADIILGLLDPQKGTLEIDGKIINNENKKSWQQTIGYVPQHIYLFDDTISSNIAFGIDKENINQKSIECAAKAANLHEFIINDLPLGYKTIIGERGIRLSGGQRQRIGLARALYHNPRVLILDEATSAMDNVTENLIMKEIYKLRKDTTIILIAHRLTTIKDCDVIFLLDKGKLNNQGTFQELIKSSKLFSKNVSKF